LTVQLLRPWLQRTAIDFDESRLTWRAGWRHATLVAARSRCRRLGGKQGRGVDVI
jgi:hypothetical protein